MFYIIFESETAFSTRLYVRPAKTQIKLRTGQGTLGAKDLKRLQVNSAVAQADFSPR